VTEGRWRLAKRCQEPRGSYAGGDLQHPALPHRRRRGDRQLDHILTDDRDLCGGATVAELMLISDHRPLVVDLHR
jgi:endonuclease/exonuclease/phosphatase (EEP) superfamily protein YafD